MSNTIGQPPDGNWLMPDSAPRASVKLIYEIAYSCIGINCFNIYIVQSMSLANEMFMEKLQASSKREKSESSLYKALGCGCEATFTPQYASKVNCPFQSETWTDS